MNLQICISHLSVTGTKYLTYNLRKVYFCLQIQRFQPIVTCSITFRPVERQNHIMLRAYGKKAARLMAARLQKGCERQTGRDRQIDGAGGRGRARNKVYFIRMCPQCLTFFNWTPLLVDSGSNSELISGVLLRVHSFLGAPLLAHCCPEDQALHMSVFRGYFIYKM